MSDTSLLAIVEKIIIFSSTWHPVQASSIGRRGRAEKALSNILIQTAVGLPILNVIDFILYQNQTPKPALWKLPMYPIGYPQWNPCVSLWVDLTLRNSSPGQLVCQDCLAAPGRLYLVILQNTVSGKLMHSCFIHFFLFIYDGWC